MVMMALILITHNRCF